MGLQNDTSTNVVVDDANNTIGTELGQSATDKISFYGATPVEQATPAADVHTVAAGSVTSVFVNTTFDGTTGTTAYTVGDIVAILKKMGLLKS